jgi:4-amino-4-deoxy-L-arabinose transferase-like glycosyltransferase
MPRNKRNVFLFWLIILAALAVRFYGLGWGLPYHYHSDEFLLAANAEKLRTTPSVVQMISQEPRFFVYPPVLMYLNISLVAFTTLFHPLSHTNPSSLTLFYLLARGIVAAFGLATVILLYFLGKRVYSQAVGLLAAFFLAFTVLHVRDSHFFCTDVPMTFFLVLIVYLSVDIMEKKGLKPYVLAGVATGIGMATKQTTVLVLPVIMAAHIMGTLRAAPPEAKPGLRSLFSVDSVKRLLLVFGITILIFLVANPFVLINPGQFLKMSQRMAQFVKGANQPQWTFQFTGTDIWYWFTNLLCFGMGPLLEVVCLIGVLWALFRRKWADGLILVFLFFYFIVIGTGYMKFIRYAIPMLPFLALLGARSFGELYGIARKRYARILISVFLAVVGIVSIFYTVAYLNVYRQEDVRTQASRWVQANIPEGSTVLINISYATPLLSTMFFKPGFYDSNTVGFGRDYFVQKDYFTIKVLNLFTYASSSLDSPDKFRKYVRERLENVDYIIMSDEHYEQFSHRPREYPAVVQFFKKLFSQRLGFQLIKTFKTHPVLFGRTINDDRSELTFRLFDHPKVMIFKRTRPSQD